MTTDTEHLKHAAQSSALRQKADRLHVLRDSIDRYASDDAGDLYAVMSMRIMALHESARLLLLPGARSSASQ